MNKRPKSFLFKFKDALGKCVSTLIYGKVSNEDGQIDPVQLKYVMNMLLYAKYDNITRADRRRANPHSPFFYLLDSISIDGEPVELHEALHICEVLEELYRLERDSELLDAKLCMSRNTFKLDKSDIENYIYMKNLKGGDDNA